MACARLSSTRESFFFFSSRRRHTRCSRDWSSDVCSSDLTFDAGFTASAVATPSQGGATALAVKPASKVASQARTTSTVQKVVEKEPAISIGLMSWIALAIAFVGTLAMGTVLPFWLVNLAQQAAQMMLR